MMDTDVLVVGGGPVAEILLAMLGHRGVDAIGFEKDAEVWPKPRAVHFDGETLRTFQAIGLGDAVEQNCLPMLNYRMENEAGEVVLDIPTGAIVDQGWCSDYMFHQPHVDSLLRAEIDRLPSVHLMTGHTVLGLSQDDDSVTCVVRGPDGSQREYRARYLVGCDGASSLVRREIGAEFTELGANDPWLIVDGIYTQVPIEGSMVFFGHHSRPKIWAAMPGNRGRMEFKILPGDDLDTITSMESISAMSRGLLTADNFDLERVAIYTFRACLADRWRDRRVFLAGDAAHLAPPLFGQGLCSGIRDAANLAWKLELVLGGTSPDILDSYQSERGPHVRSWIMQAAGMAVTIQTTDPEVAAGRDAFVQAHPESAVQQEPRIGPGLHRDAPAPAGARSIQPDLAGDQRFDDVVGSRFVVAARRELIQALAEHDRSELEEAGNRVLVLTEDDPGCAALLTSTGTAAVVVRPDRYVLGVAGDTTALSGLVSTVLTLTRPSHGSQAAIGVSSGTVPADTVVSG